MADKFFTAEARALMAEAIAEVEGNEVCFVGSQDGNGPIAAVRVIARGNLGSVPALLQGCRYGDVLIHNHPSGLLSPSDADVRLAGAAGTLGIGFLIINNSAERCYSVVEPFSRQGESPLDFAEIDHIFAPGGAIASAHQAYEQRSEQVQMAFAVAAAFNERKIALVEAGTGTGKSLAYLVPAFLWGKGNRERILVSTHTINLQEQLLGKDIPFLQRALGWDFNAVLVKGRGNYLCLRRLEGVTTDPTLFPDQGEEELEQIRQWSLTTSDGSRSDLSFLPSSQVWEEVRSEGDQCRRGKCPHFGRCFFQLARKEAAKADLLIANHSLVFADLRIRQQAGEGAAILPPFGRIILDEAHHLEEVATRTLSFSLSSIGLRRMLGRLLHPKKREKGLLPRLIAAAARDFPDAMSEQYDELYRRYEALQNELLGRSAEIDFLFTRIGELVFPEGGEERSLRLKEGSRLLSWWQEQAELVVRLIGYLADILRGLRRMLDLADQAAEILDSEGLKAAIFDCGAMVSRLELLLVDLQHFSEQTEGLCCWYEQRRSRRFGPILSFQSAPVTIDKVVRETLFDRYPTIVLTSATLTVDRGFGYFRKRNGLAEVPQGRVTELLLASPFDYREQAQLLVAADMPEPGRPGFFDEARTLIERGILAARGGTFVLFTSYQVLHRIYEEVAPILMAAGIRPLRQGDLPRHQLLDHFREAPRAALFATDSFWEGVDVPGDDLRQVIIVRLPFRVPTEPIWEARAEAIDAAGGDSFRQLSIPSAVIRFRQGVGRLVRTREDRGLVVVLDSRLATKGYGKIFLRSLPDWTPHLLDQEGVSGRMLAYFQGEKVLQDSGV